jgi:hypothetical protein
VSECDADDGIMKVMDELQDFVSKVHKTCWNKDRLTHILRSNENEHSSKFDKYEHFLCGPFLC